MTEREREGSTLHDESAVLESGLRQVQSADLLLQRYQTRRTRLSGPDAFVDETLEFAAECLAAEHKLYALAVLHLTHVLLHVGRTLQLTQVFRIIRIYSNDRKLPQYCPPSPPIDSI